MKICLCQINPTVGDIEGNKEKIGKALKKIKADLYVFPELSITGYCPQDLLLNNEFIHKNIDTLFELARKFKDKKFILGFVNKKNENIYNAAAFIENGNLNDIYYKQFLPTYSVFDEKRWFTAGNESKIINIEGKRVGLNICEDIWTSRICSQQNKKNADFFVNISASPYSKIKIEKIENILLKRYEENKKPIIYVNQVGAQDGLIYYGHSMFVNKKIKSAKKFEEDNLIINL